ncbi:MAG: hypothetical protein AB7S26_16835 [Sandaracinaceae bacterium]
MATYLYGDSHPFDGGFDFLTELRQFVKASSRALLLAHEADALEQSLGERAQEHLHAIEALQTFFDNLTNLISDRAARSGVPQIVGPYAREIMQAVESTGQRARAARAHDLDADQVDVTSKIGERRTELRAVLAEYLLTDPLPTTSWAISLALAGTTPHGQCVLSHPADLTSSFTVDVTGDGTWGRPRKVSELIEGLTLQVGWKKAFLRSSLHPDVATLDDFYIAEIELGPDSMELHLRKKPDAPRDAFLITLDVDDQGVSVAKVSRIGDTDNQPPFASPPEEIPIVERLAAALRAQCQPLLDRKRRLLFVQLEGHDVFERGLVRSLFDRIAARMAPIAEQVSAHSPNPNELSLKVERPDGRREELYLRKQELIDMVAPLPPQAQTLYAVLSFLPRMKSPPTVPPPPGRRL